MSFSSLLAKVAELQASDDEQVKASGEKLNTEISSFTDNDGFSKLVLAELGRLVPKFFYFADYSKLPGIVKIRELLEADDDDLDDGKRTAKALLMQAGAEDDYLLNPEYEPRKRELENVANAITEDVLKYWTTNQQLRVEIDISKETVNVQNGHGVTP